MLVYLTDILLQRSILQVVWKQRILFKGAKTHTNLINVTSVPNTYCDAFETNSFMFCVFFFITHEDLVYYIWYKIFNKDGGGGHWLVRMEWRPTGWSVYLPLLILTCTIKSRSSLLAPAHPGGPGKMAIKRLWWWCGIKYLTNNVETYDDIFEKKQ